MPRNIFRTKYRIVTDEYSGYEVQKKFWWWPFWTQGETNTHSSIEQAREYAVKHSRGCGKFVETVNINH